MRKGETCEDVKAAEVRPCEGLRMNAERRLSERSSVTCDIRVAGAHRSARCRRRGVQHLHRTACASQCVMVRGQSCL